MLYLPEYRRLTTLFRHARVMRRLVFPAWFQPIFLHVLARSRRVASRYLDLLAGEIIPPTPDSWLRFSFVAYWFSLESGRFNLEPVSWSS